MAESAQNTGYHYDTESQSYDDLQTDDCLSFCCTGLKPYQPTSKVYFQVWPTIEEMLWDIGI